MTAKKKSDEAPEAKPEAAAVYETTKKLCFYIAPFKDENSATRRASLGLLNSVVRPVLTPMGFDVVSSLDIASSGSITVQVIEHLLTDDLVVANLTELNPNVMYELAVRHSKRRPAVMLVQENTTLPFDIAQERTLFFRDDMAGAETLRPLLRVAVEAAMTEERPDNPIYRVATELLIRESSETPEAQKVILEKLGRLERLINSRRHVFSNVSDAESPFFAERVGIGASEQLRELLLSLEPVKRVVVDLRRRSVDLLVKVTEDNSTMRLVYSAVLPILAQYGLADKLRMKRLDESTAVIFRQPDLA